MSNFLTQGRTALLAALKADPEIAARVKTYFEFGPGLRRRPSFEPALCPVLSLSPSEARSEPVANIEREVRQRLLIELATDGQDAAQCEELLALVTDRVNACNETALGLSSEGLASLRVAQASLSPRPGSDAARPLWKASVEVELLWRRR